MKFSWQFFTETAVLVGYFEVEHDFSEGLSKRVTLIFFWQPLNFIEFLNPQDFRLGGINAKLAMTESLNYNICDFEQF